jgi:hypothetical protein
LNCKWAIVAECSSAFVGNKGVLVDVFRLVGLRRGSIFPFPREHGFAWKEFGGASLDVDGEKLLFVEHG